MPREVGWEFRANPVTVKLTNGQWPLRKREGVRADEAKPGDLNARLLLKLDGPGIHILWRFLPGAAHFDGPRLITLEENGT
jgi:hypothetical protein